MLDVPDESEAARLVADFPLVQAALITTQIIPLHRSTCDIEDMWRRNAAAVARPVLAGESFDRPAQARGLGLTV